jgi:diguanylate cyclase (GGDEF)-like protein
LRDITKREQLERALRHQALHDSLTGLANRTLFQDRLTHSLMQRRRAGGSLAVLFLDLDEFKRVNDRFGHEAGDQVLIAAAERLAQSLRDIDTSARLGGDEFTAILDGVSNEEIDLILERLHNAFGAPFEVAGTVIHLTVSIGVAIATEPAITEGELLRRADVAMYLAKSRGKSRSEVFGTKTERALRRAGKTDAHGGETSASDGTDEIEIARSERAQIRELLDAPDSVRIAYQPIFDVRTRGIAGFEALSRFDLPTPTDEVFAQAHRCGLGSFLEAKAVRCALEARRPESGFLSLNLSPIALSSLDLAREIPGPLHGIVVEVTESALASDGKALALAIEGLRERGALLAVDDAGAGHAGIKHLIDYSPDLIKIDRSVVQGSSRNLLQGAMVESLVNYARRIGALICAEGLETEDDLQFVARQGVTYGQGFLLGRPSFDPEAQFASSVPTEPIPVAGHPAETAANARERISAILSSATSWEEVDRALGLVAIAMAADQVYLSRVDRKGRYVVLMAGHGEPAFDIPYPLSEYPTTVEVLSNQRPIQVSVDDPDADPREKELLVAEGMRTALLHPVANGRQSIGLLEVYARTQRDWFAEMAYVNYVSRLLGGILARIDEPRAMGLPLTAPAELLEGVGPA